MMTGGIPILGNLQMCSSSYLLILCWDAPGIAPGISPRHRSAHAHHADHGHRRRQRGAAVHLADGLVVQLLKQRCQGTMGSPRETIKRCGFDVDTKDNFNFIVIV